MMVRYTEKTIEAFAQHSKRKEIMQAAGIGRTKYYTLKHDKEFMQKVQQHRAETITAAVQEMEINLLENVDRLQKVIREPPERGQVIINGLKLFFNVYHTMKTDAEILARLEALETVAGDVFGTFTG